MAKLERLEKQQGKIDVGVKGLSDEGMLDGSMFANKACLIDRL